ncbi:MAG TPA: cytochrome c biogenesis protein CcsA [Gaiellaceae bacterium]|nr:cytochrome c biogenesis protein CcsA [Gaiellaceae bacterium]
MAEYLFGFAFLAYAAAAIAYAGDARRPGPAGRVATWGVRLGWVLHTGLLADQAARADGFPWTSWAGSLSLFVWLVVSVYLVWGCRSRYRLLGLAVLPVAAVLLAVARLGGGTGAGRRSGYSTGFLIVHVGLLSFAFAAFTLSAALSALYLWQERRLKSHRPAVLLGRTPSLLTLDALTGRTIAVALPALTAGIVAGFIRLGSDGGTVDALMAVTLGAWAVYGSYLVLHYEAGWHGRRAAYLALAGFALVAVARLGLQVSHFS